MKLFAPHVIDLYKPNHMIMYPAGTEYVYSNFTARDSKYAQWLPDFDNKVVWLGIQGVVKDLFIDLWNESFFHKPKAEVLAKFKRRMDMTLGPGAVGTDHLSALHDLGYLPLLIKALPEGSRVNIRVPMATIINTNPLFAWLTNYIETQFSAEIWKTITSATIAYEYWRLLTMYAKKTGAPLEFVQWQAHDFSARGLSGMYDGASTGQGHLACFRGSDSVHAMDRVEEFYGPSDYFLAGSVPASEHSVMCMGGEENEVETIRRLVQDIFPSGVVSVVSDTWDFWETITTTAKALKETILARKPDANGLAKVVFRPDSGDPVKILCGDPKAEFGSPASKGAVRCLWETFGGTETLTGYKLLNPRVGLIYGDSITLARAAEILQRLDDAGFASTNVVFGIGSYTYQSVTRDTFGHAYKSTWGVVNGVERELFKDPITDSGMKKSAKGLIRVDKVGDNFVMLDRQTHMSEAGGELLPLFHNGKLLREETWPQIRARLGCITD